VLILSHENEKDYQELPAIVRKELEVHLVKTMDEVLELALVGNGPASHQPTTGDSVAAPPAH
jgi:ATP-dependent Lon protease